MIRVRTLRMVSDLHPARLALSGALSRRSRELTIRWTFRVRTAHDIFGFADGRTLRPKGDAENLASVSIVFDHQYRET